MANAEKPWLFTPVHENTAAHVLEACGISRDIVGPEFRVLDFGCGSGRYMEVFERCVPRANVQGVDVDAEALESARESGLNVSELKSSQPKLLFPDRYFDVVFSSNVIEHIPRSVYLGYVEEIARVIKPHGIFAVGAPNYPIKRAFDMFTALRHRDQFRYYFFDDPTHCNRVRIHQVESDLAPWFTDIRLMPTELPLERWLPFMRRTEVRHRLRALGYKFFGSARRRADEI
ncbi:class I SAM-dependent methyltransferase [Rhodospira trueperi]|uniref:Methyltransferase domain-containing protein n=1 Tax=Rhodospira trueperi TaxID=69960 RepID=A0A1G7GPM8_9PROT|nr:class I SAM-dependent methyltransferase [Rhodospira trueperi]SDE90100.1 Methyltransferase domain-containing protein [Rhodospira trueperi]